MTDHPSDDTLESLGAEDTWEQERVMSDKSSNWQQIARTEMHFPEWQALQRLRERAAGGNVADEDCNILNLALRKYAALEARLSKMEDELSRAVDWAEGRWWNDADYLAELEAEEALAGEKEA